MALGLSFTLALFNMISQRATRVLVILFALKLGAEPFTVGLLAATFALFPMLLSWPAGKLLDRLGPRWPLTVSAACGACGVLLPFFMPTITALFIAAAVSGLAATFFNLGLQNLVGTLSSAERRARNYSNFAMVISVANSIGPVLAGSSIDSLGYAITFPFAAAFLLVPSALLLIWGGVLPEGQRASGPAPGFRNTLTNPRIWPILAASAIAQSGLELFQVYIPVYANAHGLSATAIGVVIAMCAVGGFGARLILPQLMAWLSGERVLAYALFLGAAAFVAVPFFTTALALSVIALLFGVGLNCSQPISMTLMYARSEAGRSGEALGLRFAFDNGARVLGPIVFGLIASVLGVAAVFWINAALLGAGGVLTKPGKVP